MFTYTALREALELTTTNTPSESFQYIFLPFRSSVSSSVIYTIISELIDASVY